MKLLRFMWIPALSLFLNAGPVAAQIEGRLQLYGALDNSSPFSRTLGGIALSVGTSYLGLRGSAGVGTSSLASPGTAAQGLTDPIWSSDADLIVGPLDAGLGGVLMPYSFAGVGIGSSAQPAALTDAIRNWSFGGGLELALGRTLSLNGEARSRRLLAEAAPADSQMMRGVEYRVGMAFHFGGGRGREAGYSRRGSDSPPRGTRPGPSTRTRWPVSNSARSAAERVIPTAEEYIGVPYRYGGTSPNSGFDCSGFVQYVYAIQGVDLPRTSRQMAGAGRSVEPSVRSLEVGDLMLFTQNGRISHVAIYAGNHRFIHSSSSGGGVRYDDLDTRRGKWFAEHMVAARRVIGDNQAMMKALTDGIQIPFDDLDPVDSAPPPSK